MRKKVIEKVIDAEQYDDDFPFRYDGIGKTLLGAIEALKSIAEAIPEEHRAAATFSVDSNSGYEDSHYASIEISYLRDETDEEMERRLRSEAMEADMLKHAEINMLAKLKAKYEK
jgi:hypothetical protein